MERSNTRRTALAAAATLALAGSLLAHSAGPAGAATETRALGPTVACGGLAGLNDPNTATGVTTAAQGASSSAGTAQIRTGLAGGTRYGWARAAGGSSSYDLYFEIDINGDRAADCATFISISSGLYWTSGTQTSASSSVAFRACIIARSAPDCGGTGVASRTPWW
ncbi:hypothetical protein [Streptomyces sp. NPDC057257]|uniref:hypothetical protein n=1 Tax=Streptomyces sp. NPDC057257 TaxID=3346071 RepID=UPI00362856F9